MGIEALFWTSTENSKNGAYFRSIYVLILDLPEALLRKIAGYRFVVLKIK